MTSQLKRVTKKSIRAVFRVYMLLPAGFRQRVSVTFKKTFSRQYKAIIKQVSGPQYATVVLGDYPTWSKTNVELSEIDRQLILEDLAEMPNKPTIAIVMPTYNTDARLLAEAIESVKRQLYPNWEFCIVDDASPRPHVAKMLAEHAAADPRIKISVRTTNGHISAASNDALNMVTASYVGFLDHDDLLAEHALYSVARALQDHPDAALIYSDEDKIEEDGQPCSHHCKPDWDPFMYLACNYTCHFSVYKTDLVRKIGGLRASFEGAQDWDLTMRYSELVREDQIVHVPLILYHWRAIPGSTAQEEGAKPYVGLAQLKTVQEAMERRHLPADVVRDDELGIVHVYETLPANPPLVTVIIPTRDQWRVLSVCLDSLYRLTDYPKFEVIVVDNGSSEPATLSYFQEAERLYAIRVIRDGGKFNFSRINNLAVREASGSILCFLNNDIEIIEPNWLSRLVTFALKDGVGAVGARLIFPSGHVQHGGVIVGHGGVAGHGHMGLYKEYAGYAARAVVDQSISAVTAACMLVKKKTFDEVGGFDEKLAVAYNDVDFCLRLRELGLRNVYAGSVTCVHHESKTRGYEDTPEKMNRLTKEARMMVERWGEFANDPFYNPNLTLQQTPYSVFEPTRAPRPWLKAESN